MIAVLTCTSCGTVLREDAKFCHECGTPAVAPVDTAKYKQVTVLFADVVRSMDIAATLDVERLREIMTELVERATAVVHRYGAGSVEYTGDGVMAVFGAPVALEDHAFRACLAALAIQEEANRLATEVQSRDGVALQLRVGLNSGRVIAGALGGSGSLGYAAVGEPVGYAQRMESVAPPGGVMLSESTARLVEHNVTLAHPEPVHIKGSDEPVLARRLIAIGPRVRLVERAEARLVGRRWEMAVLDAIVNRAIGGNGGLVNVVGPPGIGKSRIAREAAELSADRQVDVFWAFCESHLQDIPFYAVTRLLRAASGVADLDDAAARARLRTDAPPGADPQDLLLLGDMLGVADPNMPLPQIDPDARRRRLTTLIKAISLARTKPTIFILEDAHWIDVVSESMFADFLTIVPRTRSMVRSTARPEYEGALTRIHEAQTIALVPLADSDTSTLLGELLGHHPSVGGLAAIIADRSAGNPFFAEEMVRELAQRGVLSGERGDHVCLADTAELSVPATVQAAIEARIDRLSVPAKQTLSAASVIGARFGDQLLAALGVDAEFDELVRAELIDQVRFTPGAEYGFRHPLIGAVAYESQLKSDRADWHRRLAEAIQQRDPGSVDENAALIAEHLESAGELQAAYGWHMRAAGWSANRDVRAARVGWARARRIADSLPADYPGQLALRIAPRTMLCATDFHGRAAMETRGRFNELRGLCDAAGDKVSLAIGMTGLASELLFAGKPGEGSRLVSEQMALLKAIGDPTLTAGLSFVAFLCWFDAGEFGKLLRWSQTVIEMADGDPLKGAGFGMGSPLAVALAFRGVARWWLGRAGWRRDFDDAVTMARNSDSTTLALVTGWCYSGIVYGVSRADDSAVRACEKSLRIAERDSSDTAQNFAEYVLGCVLLYRDDAADRRRGLELMTRAREWQLDRIPSLVPLTEVWSAREAARSDALDPAIAAMRTALDDMSPEERPGYGLYGMSVLVEALLERAADGDLIEAQAGIDRLADLPVDEVWAMRDIWVLRLRALLTRAGGDDDAHHNLARLYLTMAQSLGFEGHIDWAEDMMRA